MNEIYYFHEYEFDSPDLEGSGKRMNPDFIKKLNEARHLAGIPFIINSGYRTQEYNDSLDNSKPDSSHIKGLAVDIAVGNSRHRFIILKALIEVGFTRIGIGKGFIHVDDDKDKAPQVAWMY